MLTDPAKKVILGGLSLRLIKINETSENHSHFIIVSYLGVFGRKTYSVLTGGFFSLPLSPNMEQSIKVASNLNKRELCRG